MVPERIPRLSLRGQYRLDNIRLVQGGELLAYAEPRSAAVLVTQILITRVTSRPLTLEEIRSHGIIVDGSSTRAYNFTFGFGLLNVPGIVMSIFIGLLLIAVIALPRLAARLPRRRA